MELEAFLRRQNEAVKERLSQINEMGWKVTSTGEQEWNVRLEQAQNEWSRYCSDTEQFQEVKKYRALPNLSPLQRRQLDELFAMFGKQQLDPELAAQSAAMTKELVDVFNNYRPTLDGKPVSNNDLRSILENSPDMELRKRAWLATKQIAVRVEDQLLALVEQRNREARSLGYDNYYQMSYALQELDVEESFAIFTELLELSEEPYQAVKREIDEDTCRRFGIRGGELRPWHYTDPFFQGAPPQGQWSMNDELQGRRLEDFVLNTFRDMGLEIADIMAASDLYPRDKKYPFGYCTSMGREGKPRIMMSIDASEFWLSAMLHEFGHAAYDKYIDPSLPFLLRKPAHTLTTEGIAMLFGRITKQSEWIKRYIFENRPHAAFMREEASIEQALRRDMLVSMRWYLVFTLFERELYEHSGSGKELNERWWQLVQRIQHLQPPEHTHYPDWAAKMHFSLAPVSYQNYILGELTASHLQHYIEVNISRPMYTRETGAYLKERFFSCGAALSWNEKLREATGERLQPRYFIEQFVRHSRA